MNRTLYRFRFAKETAIKDVEETLLLGVLAAEGLIGRARLRLEFRYAVDAEANAVIIDATAPGGAAVAAMFTNFLFHELGRDAFEVRRADVACEDCGGCK